MANVGNTGTTLQLPPFKGFDEAGVPGDLEDLVGEAIMEMAPNKAVGPDGFHVEMMKAHREGAAKVMREIWKAIGQMGQIPRNWTQGHADTSTQEGHAERTRELQTPCNVIPHPEGSGESICLCTRQDF